MNVDLASLSYEDLAHALYVKGKKDGFHKVTDKTKWREPVMAAKLGHSAHWKISAGANSDEYGSDAYDSVNDKMVEYKSAALEDKAVRNLLQQNRSNGNRFAPYTVCGVYNGAYNHEAIDKYASVNHCFGIFVEELCVLIINPNTTFVINQLRNNLNKSETERAKGKHKTTNLNTVAVNLVADRDEYTVSYINKEWWEQQGGLFDYLIT